MSHYMRNATFRSRFRRGRRTVQVLRSNRPSDYGVCQGRQPLVVISCVCSKSTESDIHVTVRGLTDHAFCLFDDDPAIQRRTELRVENSGVNGCLMLEYRNCRDVSQPLSQDHVVRVERTSFYPKEVECADDAPRSRMGRQYTELKPSSTARTLKRATVLRRR